MGMFVCCGGDGVVLVVEDVDLYVLWDMFEDVFE